MILEATSNPEFSGLQRYISVSEGDLYEGWGGTI